MNTVANDQSRFEMWCSLIPEYRFASRNRKKKLKENYPMTYPIQVPGQSYPTVVNQTIWKDLTEAAVYSLDTLSSVQSPTIVPNYPEQDENGYIVPKKKGNTMYDLDCECCAPVTPSVILSDDARAKQYLSTRLSDERYTQYSKLEKKFFLHNDEAPRTPKALADRLAAGKFIVRNPTLDEEDHYYGSITQYIQWRDPTHPKDEVGYKAALEVLTAAYDAARDAIAIKSPADGLLAFQAFAAATF